MRRTIRPTHRCIQWMHAGIRLIRACIPWMRRRIPPIRARIPWMQGPIQLIRTCIPWMRHRIPLIHARIGWMQRSIRLIRGPILGIREGIHVIGGSIPWMRHRIRFMHARIHRMHVRIRFIRSHATLKGPGIARRLTCNALVSGPLRPVLGPLRAMRQTRVLVHGRTKRLHARLRLTCGVKRLGAVGLEREGAPKPFFARPLRLVPRSLRLLHGRQLALGQPMVRFDLAGVVAVLVLVLGVTVMPTTSPLTAFSASLTTWGSGAQRFDLLAIA